jgi:gas vesicle protein
MEIGGIVLRLAGIVVGGILGAAAALYFSRNNGSLRFAGINKAGQTMDQIVEQVRSRIVNLNQNHVAKTAAINEVTHIIANEPELKQEVNQVLTENQHHPIQ